MKTLFKAIALVLLGAASFLSVGCENMDAGTMSNVLDTVSGQVTNSHVSNALDTTSSAISNSQGSDQ